MAQEDYFFALAQMFLQGQKDSVDTRIALKDKEEEKRRYDEGKPLRDATLEKMLAGVESEKAQTGLLAEQTIRAKQDTEQDAQAFPVDLEGRKAQTARYIQENIAAARANDPENIRIKQDTERAALLERELEAKFSQAKLTEFEETAPTRREMGLEQLLGVKATREEQTAGRPAREAILNAQKEEAIWKVSTLPTPEEVKRTNKLRAVSEQLSVLAQASNIEASQEQTTAAILQNMRAAKIMDEEDAKPLANVVNALLVNRAGMIRGDASEADVENYVKSANRLLTTAAALRQKDNALTDANLRPLALVQERLKRRHDAGEINLSEYIQRLSLGIDKIANQNLIALSLGDTDEARPSDALGGMFTPPESSRKPVDQPATANPLDAVVAPSPPKSRFDQASDLPAKQEEQRQAKVQQDDARVTSMYRTALEGYISQNKGLLPKLRAEYQRSVGKAPSSDDDLAAFVRSAAQPYGGAADSEKRKIDNALKGYVQRILSRNG